LITHLTISSAMLTNERSTMHDGRNFLHEKHFSATYFAVSCFAACGSFGHGEPSADQPDF